MTDKVQKIREEVERLMNELIQEREKGYGSDVDDACVLELQNVLTYIDSLQEEPVSEGRDIFDNCLKSEEKFILPQKISGNINCENCLYSSACALGDIQECVIDKPVSEDLKVELEKYIKGHFTIDKEQLDRFGIEEKDYMYTMDRSDMLAMVEHFTNWQKIKEESVSEDLEEACEQLAENARKHKAETSSPFFSPTDYKQGVMDGAKWQKEQLIDKACE